MISFNDYTQGRDREYPLTKDQQENVLMMLEKLRALDEEYNKKTGYQLVITSGYRPAAINKTISGAKSHDAHERCLGVDLHDPHMVLSDFCLENLKLLERLGLWMESPQSAKDHVHLQGYPPKSGRRVFIA